MEKGGWNGWKRGWDGRSDPTRKWGVGKIDTRFVFCTIQRDVTLVRHYSGDLEGWMYIKTFVY